MIKVSIEQQSHQPFKAIHMKFGFFKILLLCILIIAGGGFAWLALTDLPLQQQEMTVNVPLNAGR